MCFLKETEESKRVSGRERERGVEEVGKGNKENYETLESLM